MNVPGPVITPNTCKHENNYVYHTSRPTPSVIVRYRKCKKCKATWKTVEQITIYGKTNSSDG